eukprot:m.113068 g.113068  ORF g.113068 m.113068 type:complete len:50 (-) comp12795_c0_seq33:1457-1606(-)
MYSKPKQHQYTDNDTAINLLRLHLLFSLNQLQLPWCRGVFLSSLTVQLL